MEIVSTVQHCGGLTGSPQPGKGSRMRTYRHYRNLRIDGDEYTSGFLGLDWFPSEESSRARQRYESGVERLLDRIRGTGTGLAVVSEIGRRPNRVMTIRPYRATAATGPC